LLTPGQKLLDELHVVPALALLSGIAQQKCGVVRGDELTAAIGEDEASKARDPFVGSKKVEGRHPPEGANHLRTHGVDLPVEERAAGLHSVGLRIADMCEKDL